MAEEPRPNALTNVDIDAVEIGDRYRRLRGSMIDNVREAIAIGERLIAKRNSLNHGEWLPWLEAHTEMLGFSDRTANAMMRAAKLVSKSATAADLDSDTALKISRLMWSHPEDRAAPKQRHERVASRTEIEIEIEIEIERVHLNTRIKELEQENEELRSRAPSEPSETEIAQSSSEIAESNSEESDNIEVHTVKLILQATAALTTLSRSPIQDVQAVTKAIIAFQSAVTKLHRAERQRRAKARTATAKDDDEPG
jgi:hypothetical protein